MQGHSEDTLMVVCGYWCVLRLTGMRTYHCESNAENASAAKNHPQHDSGCVIKTHCKTLPIHPGICGVSVGGVGGTGEGGRGM